MSATAHQYSPMVALLGKAWETTGSTGQTAGWQFQTQGVDSSATARTYLSLYHNSNGSLEHALSIQHNASNATTLRNPTGQSLNFNSSNDNATLSVQATQMWFYVGATGFDLVSGTFRPGTDNATAIGQSTKRLTEVWTSKVRNTSTVTAQTDLPGGVTEPPGGEAVGF